MAPVNPYIIIPINVPVIKRRPNSVLVLLGKIILMTLPMLIAMNPQ